MFLFFFLSFMQVGLFGIGGNASAQALLEHEAITLHHWFTPEQMTNLVAFCRVLPGGTGVNAATLSSAMAASAQYGFWGTLAASTLSVVSLAIPSALWTSVYSTLQRKEQYKHFYDCAMVVLRPLIPGLIAAAAILLMRPDSFSSLETSPWEFGVSIFLFLSTLVGVGIYRINSLLMIILCGIAGSILL